MKNLKPILSLTFSLCFGLGTLAPKPSQAMLLTDSNIRSQGEGSRFAPSDLVNEYVWAAAIICAFILPICIYGEKVPASHRGVTKSDLRAQGYSEAEVMRIFKDQTQLANRLRKLKLRAIFAKNETRQTLSRGVRNIYPQASDTYVKFLGDQL